MIYCNHPGCRDRVRAIYFYLYLHNNLNCLAAKCLQHDILKYFTNFKKISEDEYIVIKILIQ